MVLENTKQSNPNIALCHLFDENRNFITENTANPSERSWQKRHKYTNN